MIRLKDIALRAGVSIMTVSKVMRDAPDISASTKARIRQLAEEMGYVPDSLARGLRNRTPRLFGLLISSATNPIFARTVMAIEQRVRDLGYDLIVGHTLNEIEREESYIRRFLSRRVDGLFISPVYRLQPEARIYRVLARHGTPTVLLNHRAPFCDPFPSVATDDLQASSKVTRHLIQLGHRDIAFFSGPQVSPEAQERFEGYRRALAEAQIPYNEKLVFQAGGTIEEGRRAAEEFLAERPRATAIQAVSDLVAIGTGATLLESGLNLPGDLSLTGFGNVLSSEFFRVPLTTIRQPKYRLGLAAVESMLQLTEGRHPGSRRLSANLEIRQSTAAPPAAKKHQKEGQVAPATGSAPA